MSQDSKMDRRGFLNVAAASVGTLTIGYLLAGCQPKEGAGGGAPAGGAAPAADANKPLDCTDVSALSDADKGTRTGLQYVEKAADPAKECDKCALYTAPAGGSGCGGCTVVKGPINPKGSCTAFAPKA